MDARPTPPYRQIRASHNAQTITIYQAYPGNIAIPAVREQRLSASPHFSSTRMTWIKLSWCWMMYRSGYSLKDANQAHILALSMTHENFENLLAEAVVHHGKALETRKDVRVQWDPERDFRLERLPYRSIQIGISGEVGKRWVEEWIDGIEDVTEKARELKRALEEDKDVRLEDLITRGLIPVETDYKTSRKLREILEMDVQCEKR